MQIITYIKPDKYASAASGQAQVVLPQVTVSVDVYLVFVVHLNQIPLELQVFTLLSSVYHQVRNIDHILGAYAIPPRGWDGPRVGP